MAADNKRLDLCYNSQPHKEQEVEERKNVSHSRTYSSVDTFKNTTDLYSDFIHENYVNFGLKKEEVKKSVHKERTFIMIKPDGVQRA